MDENNGLFTVENFCVVASVGAAAWNTYQAYQAYSAYKDLDKVVNNPLELFKGE